MFSLVTESSIWLLPLCILVGAIYALILYFKNRTTEFPKRTKILLSVLRGTVIAMIAFLLLTPMIKLRVKKSENPILFIALDQSESIKLNSDSAWYTTTFVDQVNQIEKGLGDDYIIEKFVLGEEEMSVAPDVQFTGEFDKKATNLSSLFARISSQYSDRNVGAVAIFTDGIYNVGSNPFYKVNAAPYPVYAVGLGNPEMQTDLAISQVLHNPQTFKGNYFPVEIKIAATKLAGKSSKLTILEGDSLLSEQIISIENQQYFETVKLSLEAKKVGIQRYTAVLEAVEGESTDKNNETAFFIEVVEQREKIAVIYHAPHPDIGAIHSALQLSTKYETNVFPVEQAPEDLTPYSLVVLHQLPSVKKESTSLLQQIREHRISTLYIIGSEIHLPSFNNSSAGLTINASKQKALFNESFPAFNQNFLSFSFDENSKMMLKNYPPLQTYFGEYKAAISSDVFMYQEISKVPTSYPLLMFNEQNGVKSGVIAGTGIWQWKIYNYLHASNHDIFNDIINKIALYLSVKSDKSYFRIFADAIYNENQSVVLTAELYDETYQLINTPDVALTVTHEDGTNYEALFSKEGNSYTCMLGQLPIGEYRWSASSQLGNKQYQKSGAFTVREVMLEASNLVAQHQMLQEMATSTNGAFYTANDFSEMVEAIKTNDNIKTIVSYEQKHSPILNSWFYFLIAILLFGVEWFLRKWHGGY